MRSITLWVYTLSSFFLCSFSVFAIDKVRYNLSVQFPDPKQKYYIDLLKLALEESKAEYGDYILEPVIVEMPQGRTSIMVERNIDIDVTWRMTSIELEERLNAIYFPLLKGQMGYRIFIIRAEDKALFENILTIAELQKLLAGQGYDWPDADILVANGFKVTLGGAYGLLEMLEHKRFDYFPRALHEPWDEIYDQPQFIVDEHILIKYPAPLYFFVSKENTYLHKRLTQGLLNAKNNGSFDRFYLEHPITRDTLLRLKLEKRVVFELKNPLLSAESARVMGELEN